VRTRWPVGAVPLSLGEQGRRGRPWGQRGWVHALGPPPRSRPRVRAGGRARAPRRECSREHQAARVPGRKMNTRDAHARARRSTFALAAARDRAGRDMSAWGRGNVGTLRAQLTVDSALVPEAAFDREHVFDTRGALPTALFVDSGTMRLQTFTATGRSRSPSLPWRRVRRAAARALAPPCLAPQRDTSGAFPRHRAAAPAVAQAREGPSA
jgi:hypothetical protein